MSNVKVLEPKLRVAVDNERERRDHCAKIFANLAVEHKAVNMFAILQLADGSTTFHSTMAHTADVLFLIEQFKHDLLSGRYDVSDGDVG